MTRSGRIQAVFFDAAGTLFRVRGSVAEIYLSYAEKHGFKRTAESLEAIRSAFSRAFRDAPPPVFAATESGELKQCERLWWFDLVHNVFYRVGMFERFDEFFDEVFQAFEGSEWWVLYPDTVEALKQLRDHGYELGIISNFDSRLFTVLRSLGLTELFDTVTISSLAHSAKPATQIFRLAVEKHALELHEAVHVGDSLKDDAEGARAAGLVGVLLNRDGNESYPSSTRAIKNLSELLPLLDTLQ